MFRRAPKGEQRSESQIREHYEIEKELAGKLRSASKEERRTLYTSLYEELFERLPQHPQLTRKSSPERQKEDIKAQLILLNRFLDKDTTFLEVGPGDCAVVFEVSRIVKNSIAVDVSKTITSATDTPDNFELILTNGSNIPVQEHSINVIYSNQLMEHLHPDDAYDQLHNIVQALVPGGVYICLTPNGINGPHDISMYFDDVATGFHLKEYTVEELGVLFRQAGFSKVMIYLGRKGRYINIPIFPVVACERILKLLPRGLRRKLANTKLISAIIYNPIMGIK